MNGIDLQDGPHFDRDMFGPRGQLLRLHKGGGQSAPKPNPVARQPLDDQARAAGDEREEARKRRGYQSSVLSQFATDEGGGKTVLG